MAAELLAWRTPKGHVYCGLVMREHDSGAVTVIGTHGLVGGEWVAFSGSPIEYRAHRSGFKKPEEFIKTEEVGG